MNNRDKRRAKTRHTIKGTDKKPRLVVFRSNRYFYGQVIDDTKGQTLMAVEKSKDVEVSGKELGEKVLKKGIVEIVFDRAGYRYHGKIKKFADAVRSAGVKF